MTEIQSTSHELDRLKEKIQKVTSYCDLVFQKAKENETKIAVELIKKELEKI